MNIDTNCTDEDLLKVGIYKILNLNDGKFYIGSTNQYFLKRFTQHYSELVRKKHKNQHLQNAWNKHKSDAFSFQIVEIISDKRVILEKEQYYLDTLQPFKHIGYNINPLASGTPNLSKETILKRAKTMKDKYASGELISYFLGKDTWNKGLTKDKRDYSYLKVPKTISKKLKLKWSNRSEYIRNNSLPVGVYKNNNLILIFRSSLDLQDWSCIVGNKLPIEGRFKTDRKGLSKYTMSSFHVNRVLSGKIDSYKGLHFKYIKDIDKSLHKVICVEKPRKIEEPCNGNIETAISK